ncbi:MAG: methionyl aminopeptidase, partial [Bacilli bacterium]|nr:methionyl aminopeptidase [Bacilli bacterium]
MIIIKSPREIALMEESGRIVATVFEEVGQALKPGMTTKEISDLTDQIFHREGARSAELGYGGYPAAACVSVNEELIHGIPSKKKVLRDGDIVSLDIVAIKNGYMADACRTFVVGIAGERAIKIIKAA